MDVPTKEILHQTMLKQIDQDYALPKDVFDDLQCDVNAKVGLKFLKAMSSQPDIYKNVKAKRRKHKWVPS